MRSKVPENRLNEQNMNNRRRKAKIPSIPLSLIFGNLFVLASRKDAFMPKTPNNKKKSQNL